MDHTIYCPSILFYHIPSSLQYYLSGAALVFGVAVHCLYIPLMFIILVTKADSVAFVMDLKLGGVHNVRPMQSQKNLQSHGICIICLLMCV